MVDIRPFGTLLGPSPSDRHPFLEGEPRARFECPPQKGPQVPLWARFHDLRRRRGRAKNS